MERAETSTRRASAPVLFALVAFLFAGCSRDTSSTAKRTPEASSTSAHHVPPPPDVGDIGHFHQCGQRPQHELNQYQSCLAARLGAAQCTPAVDCVLACLASPDGRNVGGGCDHVCFGYNVYHEWKDRPAAMDECRQDPAAGERFERGASASSR